MDSQASIKLLLIDDDEVDIMQFERALKKNRTRIQFTYL